MATVSGFTGSIAGETVSFTQDGGTGSIGSADCTLPAGAGSVSCSASLTSTGAGSATVEASYAGGDSQGNGGSLETTAITITQATSTVGVGCAPSTVIVGSSTTCTATVTGYPPGDATGTITFSQNGGSGKTSIATSPAMCALVDATCQVTLSTSGAGAADITASYPGDTNNQPSSGGAFLTISPAPTSTNIACAPAIVLAGQTTMCTATVTGDNPTGIITWQSTDRSGIFSSNPCTLAAYSCNVSYTATSSALITATYSGDINNGGSQGTFSIAANVNQAIQITVANSGPPTSVSLSSPNCSITPSTIVANGTPQSFVASSGCVGIVVTLPPAGTNSQYLTAGGLGSLPISSCASSSCQVFSATIYYQVENTYQATPKSPASWSTPGSIVVNGTSLGVPAQTICTIKVSTGSGQFSCQGWTDYNTQAVMGVLPVPPTQRWAPSQSSFADITGGNVHSSNYFSQVLEEFQYSLVGSTTAPSAPALSFTSLGAGSTFPLIGSPSSVWLDSGSSWSVPAALTGSTSSERWASTVTSGAATAGQTVSLAYYHQFLVNFAFSVTGGGTAYSSPLVSFTAFGVPTTGSQGWVDYGSAYGYTNPLAGSTPVERWFTTTAAGTISGAGTVSATYYHQFAFALSYTVSGGGVYSNARLNYTSLGSPGLEQLNGTQTTFWFDAGTKWGATPLLPSSSSTERWITKGTSSGTASAPLQAQLLYYHQYLGTLRYTIQGTGGSPPVPRLNYTSYGASLLSPLNATASPVWMDAGSSWEVPLLLPGVHGERWMSNVTGSVSAGSAFVMDAQYTHQFYVEVGVSTPAGGQVANTDQWEDQYSYVTLNATSAKLWSFVYWQGATPFSYNGTTRLPTLTVSGPANETAIFFPGLTISTDSFGSVTYSFGTTSGTVSANSQATIYPAPGRNVTLTAMPNTVEIMFGGWTGGVTGTQQLGQALQTAISINSPGLVHASFATDYTDIRTFAVATIGVFLAACYIFIIKRGFVPKVIKRQMPP